jgi:predicted nucleic acid-binding protein
MRPEEEEPSRADLAIAATALTVGARLLTKNVRHFPMFADLHPSY